MVRHSIEVEIDAPAQQIANEVLASKPVGPQPGLVCVDEQLIVLGAQVYVVAIDIEGTAASNGQLECRFLRS